MKDPVNISTKLDSCGRVCMLLRYSEDYKPKVYRFLNLKYEKDCVQLRCTVDRHYIYGEIQVLNARLQVTKII